MDIFFAALFGAGVTCFALFTQELIQGRVKRNTLWSAFTVDQRVLYIGAFLMPIGLIGFTVFGAKWLWSMIRKKGSSIVTIDLTGPEGNAYVLLGYAKNFAEQLSLDYEVIREEMTSGDYGNLVNVFDKHFGSFVILER